MFFNFYLCYNILLYCRTTLKKLQIFFNYRRILQNIFLINIAEKIYLKILTFQISFQTNQNYLDDN